MRILLLPILLALLLSLFLVDFSQKIWYNHGIVGGGKASAKKDFIFLGKTIFIKMDNYEDAMQYIEEQEATKISYVKVGNNNKKLIVSFASNRHDGFEQKKSLMDLKYKRNDFDVLYLRNQLQWYLGGLNGIGKNINHTIAFLKKEFSKYKVLCTGFSAGGYASLLFGSLLKVNKVITFNAQTDLQYIVDNLPEDNNGRLSLIKRSKECPATWSKYNKIVNVLNENTTYNVFYKGNDVINNNLLNNLTKKKNKKDEVDLIYKKNKVDSIYHGDYHCDEIKNFPNVSGEIMSPEIKLLVEATLNRFYNNNLDKL